MDVDDVPDTEDLIELEIRRYAGIVDRPALALERTIQDAVYQAVDQGVSVRTAVRLAFSDFLNGEPAPEKKRTKKVMMPDVYDNRHKSTVHRVEEGD